MEHSNVFAGAVLSGGALADASQLPEEWRLARAARLNVLVLGMPRINPLLTDLEGSIPNVLERILPDLEEPIVGWCPGSRLVLPPVSRARTLILHEVGSLVFEDFESNRLKVVQPGSFSPAAVDQVFAVFESENEVTVVTSDPSSGTVLDSWFYIFLAC